MLLLSIQLLVLCDFSPLGLEWFHVDDTDGHIWVYGAFWDGRDRGGDFWTALNIQQKPPYIRILMNGPFTDAFVNELTQATCEYYYEEWGVKHDSNQVLGVSVPKQDDIYAENKARPYFVYCQPPNLKNVPKAVTLLVNNFERRTWYRDMNGHPRKWLFPIRGNYDPISNVVSYSVENSYTGRSSSSSSITSTRKQLMVCVRPFYSGPWHDLHTLANFLIWFDVMGVQHFNIYDAGDATPQTYRLLNIAKKIGISIDMPLWNMRENSGHEMHQTVTQDLCLYDAMILGFENVLTLNLDEIIVPSKPATGQSPKMSLLEVLDELDALHPDAAYYRFQNLFYTMTHPDNPISSSKMMILKKTRHHDADTVHFSRSKCAYKPHRTAEATFHLGNSHIFCYSILFTLIHL